MVDDPVVFAYGPTSPSGVVHVGISASGGDFPEEQLVSKCRYSKTITQHVAEFTESRYLDRTNPLGSEDLFAALAAGEVQPRQLCRSSYCFGGSEFIEEYARFRSQEGK